MKQQALKTTDELYGGLTTKILHRKFNEKKDVTAHMTALESVGYYRKLIAITTNDILIGEYMEVIERIWIKYLLTN